ncbi:MAG: DUF547 domain-containing protein [Erythrobacter sp.]
MLKSLLAACGIAAVALAAPAAQANSGELPFAASAATLAPVDPAFVRFAPGDRLNARQLDYTAWSEAMDYLVFPMGRSLRETAGRPEPGMGTRRMYGHDSIYRLEGNRVMFGFFTDDLRQMVADYRSELEQIGGQIGIASLPRNEQLAYWINLHNVAMIEQIAKAWPIRQPRDILIDGVPLDQAKFITVDGVRMSPHDIRHQIVYRHWKDPRVIYGFWRGDIGGPSISSDAYSGASVAAMLDRNAREFVNSLRGVQENGGKLQVSTIYEEARPYFFADWPSALRAHLAAFAEQDVQGLLTETSATEAVIYEADIADLEGGVREPTYSLVTTNRDGVDKAQSFRIPQGIARLLSEQTTKAERLQREGRTGRVIFNPVTLPGTEGPAEVQ